MNADSSYKYADLEIIQRGWRGNVFESLGLFMSARQFKFIIVLKGRSEFTLELNQDLCELEKTTRLLLEQKLPEQFTPI